MTLDFLQFATSSGRGPRCYQGSPLTFALRLGVLVACTSMPASAHAAT